MTSVNTNIGAINAAFNMTKNTKAMTDAMARLSSGLRVNTAADDSAGVSIAQTMEAQIRGLSQAIRNADDELTFLIKNINRQFLHAKLIGLRHPISGKYLEFKTNLPKDLNNILKKLRKTQN